MGWRSEGLVPASDCTTRECIETQIAQAELMLEYYKGNDIGWDKMPEEQKMALSKKAEAVCTQTYENFEYTDYFEMGWPFSTEYISFSEYTPVRPIDEPTGDADVDKKLSQILKDEINFWNLLIGTMSQVPLAYDEYRTLNVLNIGCGVAFETFALNSFLGGGNFPLEGSGVNTLGIDIDLESIEDAKQLNIDRTDANFIVADATDLSKLPNSEEGYDFISIRHQNIGNGSEVWEKIFSEALRHLNEGGVIYITSYSCVEYAAADKYMQEIGAQVLLSGGNPLTELTLSLVTDNYGVLSRDKYVGVYGWPK